MWGAQGRIRAAEAWRGRGEGDVSFPCARRAGRVALLTEHPWVDLFLHCGPVTLSKFHNDSTQTLRPFGVKLADTCRRRCSSRTLGAGKPSLCWTASQYEMLLENDKTVTFLSLSLVWVACTSCARGDWAFPPRIRRGSPGSRLVTR